MDLLMPLDGKCNVGTKIQLLKNPVRRFPIYLIFYVMNPPHPLTFPGKVKYRGKKALTFQEIECGVLHLYVHP